MDTDAVERRSTTGKAVRRRALVFAIAVFATGWVGSSGSNLASAETGTQKERPNIVFILSDNFRWDCMGFMNHPFIETPALDRLAREGIVFSNAFNTTSLCSPSRASILTGTYAHTHGVLNNHTPWTGKKPTFLEHLKKAGYDTAFIGKWHMPGKGLPGMPYLDLFVSYTYREGQGSYFDCPLIVNGRPEPSQEAYITGEMTRRAIEFMEDRVSNPGGAGRPFCVYLSHRTAHPPFHAPKGFAGMYDDKEVSLPKGVDAWFSRTNGNVFQGIMMGSYENQYRRYCEVITAMDRDIARLLDRMNELGLAENTIVIYAGDNGMMWGEHRLHGIKYPYEECIRLALIVRCPWLVQDPGRRRTQMVLNLDFAPTLLDVAGVPVPSEMEGESLLPILKDGNRPGRKAWLLEYWKYYPENLPSYVGVRTDTHKFIEYEKTLEPELFDLTNDPGEENNFYGTPEGERILPALKGMLEALKSGKQL